MTGLIIRLAAAAAAALALAGCGGSSSSASSGPRDESFLTAAGFSAPVMVEMSLQGIWAPQGALIRGRDTSLAALLVAAGQLNVVPRSGSAPYWSFSAAGQDSADRLALAVGERQILERRDVRHWSVGAVDCFAETISYVVNVAQPLRARGVNHFGPFQFRLVVSNDPAAGQWQLGGACGASQPLADTETVLETLVAAGAPLTTQLETRISAAQNEAHAGVERELAAAGIVARGPVPNTVISRNNRRIWYIGGFDTANAVYRDIFRMCGGLRIAAGRNWRPPSLADFDTITRPAPDRENERILYDAPDGRLFGSVIPPRGAIGLLRSELFTYNGEPATLARIEPGALYRISVYKRDDLTFRPDMSLASDPANYPILYQRLICVADYAPR
jgi:hypothetical protein